MEFVLMERLWSHSGGVDSYDPYTCAVQSAQFLECLDIAGARTLGNSLSDKVAYNMTGSSGDLNKNFYAVLALEGLLNMSFGYTGHFGGDVKCNGKNVGDGVVNAYDVAALMWYQFKFEPYDQLPHDPWLVITVQGRDDTAYRCKLGESRRDWQLALGEDYCHSGQSSNALGYDSQRRLSREIVPRKSILNSNLFEAYQSVPARPNVRNLYEAGAATVINARENRGPSERRLSINNADMLRGVNSMRTLDIDVAEWGVVQGHGRWLRIRAPGVQVALELYLSGISVDDPVHLSLQNVPAKNCTSCKPVDENARRVVVAFARRAEYDDEYANAISSSESSICADIVPATLQSSAMMDNTIALRQQPPNRACGFDIFLWVPEFPMPGIHVSKIASPYSISARRLATVGAESALADANEGCDNDIGVLSGSSAMDGFRGQIQRSVSCARYGFTQAETLQQVTGDVSIYNPEQCAAMSCNAHAPARSEVVSRSFDPFGTSGLESAYADSLQILKMRPRAQDKAVVDYSVLYTHARYTLFESTLALESLGNNCCEGFTCTAQADTEVAHGICHLSSHAPPTSPPPRSPSPPTTWPEQSSQADEAVIFGLTVAGEIESFNVTHYELQVALITGVSTMFISSTITAASIKVETQIRVLRGASLRASSIARDLKPFLVNETMASQMLKITVEDVFMEPMVISLAPTSEANVGVATILILTLAPLLVVASICFVVVERRKHLKPKAHGRVQYSTLTVPRK